MKHLKSTSSQDSPSVRSAPLKARAVKLLAKYLHVGTLPLARWAFRGVDSPFLVKRRFLGYDLIVDASRTDTHRLLYIDGERFVNERELVASLLTPGASIVEVGANIGYFTLLYQAKTKETGKILCLEPEPTNLEELRRNIEENEFRNVEVLPVAASNVDQVVTLRSGINGVIGQGGDLRVTARRLDGLIKDKVDFLKIDVEGHEVHVLDGATGVLARDQPTVLVEIHPELIHHPFQVEDATSLLAKYYDHITAYVPRLGGSLVRRLRARYSPARSLEVFTEPLTVVEACRQGVQREPFWLVARRS